LTLTTAERSEVAEEEREAYEVEIAEPELEDSA